MNEILAQVIIGHLVGDFLFQSKEMALRKSERGWLGFWLCTLHCLTYTGSFMCCLVYAAMLLASLGVTELPVFNLTILAVGIFLPHWIIDRYSLAHVWLKFFKGRTFESAYASTSYRELDLAFTCIVYTVVDFTLHFITLFIVLELALAYGGT